MFEDPLKCATISVLVNWSLRPVPYFANCLSVCFEFLKCAKLPSGIELAAKKPSVVGPLQPEDLLGY